MKKTLLALIVLAALPLASGCKWFKSPAKENLEPPTELTEIPNALKVDKLWSKGLGKGVGKAGLRLKPAYMDGRLFASDGGGDVYALDPEKGTVIWRTDTKADIGSSPGVGEGTVAVGTLDGEVIALDADTGAERWRGPATSEIVAAPAVAAGLVIARSYDGRVYAFDVKSGERRWVFDRTVPLLSLRGNGPPTVAAGKVLLGYDNGKIDALRLSDGNLAWEQTLANSEGRTELARMVDIDGELGVGPSEVFGATFQGQIGGLTLDSGRQLWSREFSAYGGVAFDSGQVFSSDADGNVWDLEARSGASVWKQDALAHRWLSTPAFAGGMVVVGDFEGYVHWLSADTGELRARVKLGDKGVRAAPVAVGNVVYVTGAKGELAAYRVAGG